MPTQQNHNPNIVGSNELTWEQKNGWYLEHIQDTQFLSWEQATGKWRYFEDGKLILSGTGYSGGKGGRVPLAVNNPGYQCEKGVGPLPKGHYVAHREVPARSSFDQGIRLLPASTNNMCGRTSFTIHGDHRFRKNSASAGCLIINGLNIRRKIKDGTAVWVW